MKISNLQKEIQSLKISNEVCIDYDRSTGMRVVNALLHVLPFLSQGLRGAYRMVHCLSSIIRQHFQRTSPL